MALILIFCNFIFKKALANWRAGRAAARADFAKKHFLVQACRHALAGAWGPQGARVGKGGKDLTRALVPVHNNVIGLVNWFSELAQ